LCEFTKEAAVSGPWVIGYIIGAVVVVAVAALVITLILQARKIGDQFVDIRRSLDEGRANTEGLWAASDVNRALERAATTAATMRRIVSGGGE
jgi:hypothetical protein